MATITTCGSIQELAVHDSGQRWRRPSRSTVAALEHGRQSADGGDLSGSGGQSISYLVYGAQQDNTTVIAPSLALATASSSASDQGVRRAPSCPTRKSGDCLRRCKASSAAEYDHSDEQQYWVGAESLYGNGGDTLMYRFQRVSPMEVSPYAPHTVYYGSQYLHRSSDGGRRGRPSVRPDGAPEGTQARAANRSRAMPREKKCTHAVRDRESPLQKDSSGRVERWLVFVTRDDGKT